MNTKKKIAVALAVLMVAAALAVPAIADYSGDYPLTTYEHGMLNSGGIVYETVTDGGAYTKLPCNVYPEDPVYGLTQEITIRSCVDMLDTNCIPEGKTVKMARLYNYVTWSTSDNDTGKTPWFNIGLPAEAEMTFNGVTVTCQNPLSESCTCLFPPVACRDALPNPIDYGNGIVQYWDTKGPDYDCGAKWDYPSGTFAWDVTNIVKESIVDGSGTFTATITNADSTPTGMRPGKDYHPYNYRERFVTYGFGLLVVYENDDPEVDLDELDTEYWITEGCDLLYNTSKYSVYEPIATTSVQFEKESKGPKKATLTTVLTASDKWNLMEWDESKNMVYFNDKEIGPSTAKNYYSIGVNEFDVGKLKKDNIAEFQDRDLGTGKGDNEVVSNAFLVTE